MIILSGNRVITFFIKRCHLSVLSNISYFIFIFFIASSNLISQNLKRKTFEHLTPDQGMSQYIVLCMIQDRTGYLWFGTFRGVDRYDGKGFTSYKPIPGNPNSISSGSVQALCEDKDGNIWIGTSLGLDKLDPSTGNFTHHLIQPVSEGVDLDNYVLSICEDEDGLLWVGTADGLNKFDKTSGKFKTFKHNKTDTASISDNYVHALLISSDGSLWVGTGNGLNKLDRKTGKFIHYWQDPKKQNGSVRIEWYNTMEYSNPYQINFIYEDNSGMLWLCTNGEGLIEFNPNDGSYKTYKHNPNNPQSLSSNDIKGISQDQDGIYWIATKFNGLNTFNKQANTFTHYYEDVFDPGSLSVNMVSAINCERSGTIWVASFAGVNKIDRKNYPFKQYNSVEGSWDKSISTFVTGIVKRYDDKLWIEERYGNMLLFDPVAETFTRQFNKNQTGETYLAEDDLGNIWIASRSGGIYVKEKNGNKTKIKYDTGEEFNQQINCIYTPPSNDTAWVGTLQGGIYFIYKPDKTISLFESVNTTIKCIYKDSYGLLWVGTKDDGVIQYSESLKKFTLFQSDINDHSSISGNFISTIYEDKNGDVWFGTNIGLNKFIRSSESFIHFAEEEGLPDNTIYDIKGDAQGNLWFPTNKGISKLNSQTGQIKNYDLTYGFTSNRFYFTGAQTKNGEIYFGGPGGLTRFHPDSIKDNPYIPPIVITSFRIFDQPIFFGNSVQLAYDKNFLSFEFAALSYLSPERNQYAYKMEGVDKDWVYSGTRHFASYPNLAPGDYTFRVKGSNNDGVWNEEGTSLSIIISPPWWRSNWAYFGYVLIIVIGLYWIRGYEMNRIKLKDKIKLDEAVLKERVETDKMKSRFFANISHEFRTPLTLILGPAEKINLQTSNDVIKDSGIIKRNAKRLLQLVNQLLDLSKLEAGKLQLQASKGNIVSFVKGLTMSFESLAERKDIKLKVTAEQNDIELYFDRDKMAKILANLLSNAFKFTNEGGEITVTLTLIPPPSGRGMSNLPAGASVKAGGQGKGEVQIKVSDTGIGISEEELPKLFDRFYQVDSSQTREHEGTGIGLALTKELVELHHGKISVTSKVEDPDKVGIGGSEFIVELPLGREHLRDDEIIDEVETKDIVILSDLSVGESGAKNLIEDVPEITEDSSRQKDGQAFTTLQNDNEQDKDKTIILVVEDNADVREYIKDSLGSNFQIEEASNGEQGVKKAAEIIPDLIISDIMMPKMDGNELTRRIKNDERTSHIPVILLTAKSEHESKLEGLETGADDYLTKPFDTKELQVRIKNLISIRRKLQEKFSGEKIVTTKIEKKLSKLDEKFLSKVLEVVESHLSEEGFSIEEFGNEVGMGRVQLHRKLKALTGKSPSLYLRSVRLAKAKKMIEEKTGNISEIAYSTGFSSPAYFSACFKEEFGYPPSEMPTK
jgi:signal transduction histidine kinase/ligand-binding sensor domain-containing protein/DNA-binding NarL/FixJ family response regulator